MSLAKPRLKKDMKSSDQLERANKYKAVEELAKSAGFDDDAFAHTEFCLMPFFDLIVNKCAEIAEKQSYTYTGENKESTGCLNAANAIRVFGEKIGNIDNE